MVVRFSYERAKVLWRLAAVPDVQQPLWLPVALEVLKHTTAKGQVGQYLTRPDV